MCFSATASFGAGVVLSGLGAASLTQVRKPTELPFAGIPVIFAVQQFAEGFLWLALTNPEYHYLKEQSIFVFLFFALAGWPLWVPLSMWLLEQDPKRKKIQAALLGAGILLFIYMLYCMRSFEVQASLRLHNIHYDLDFPQQLSRLAFFLYVVCTIVPSFVSSVWLMRVFATFSLGSLIISLFFSVQNLVSVWCFFAAALSILVMVIMTMLRRKEV